MPAGPGGKGAGPDSPLGKAKPHGLVLELIARSGALPDRLTLACDVALLLGKGKGAAAFSAVSGCCGLLLKVRLLENTCFGMLKL
jgi:hypothetical protein